MHQRQWHDEYGGEHIQDISPKREASEGFWLLVLIVIAIVQSV